MAEISDKNLALIKELYYKKLYSAKEIAQKLHVSIDAVYYFMRHHNLKRRTFSEDNLIRFSKKKASFNLKSKLSKHDKELKIIGAILYWGEGYKAEKSCGIDFANSDPKMIGMFVKFLRNICGVKESKLRVLLYCYQVRMSIYR